MSSSTVAPNKHHHQEVVMMTTEVSPTGIEAFDSHFNFYNASRSTCTSNTTTEVEDGGKKSSANTSPSNDHQSSPQNIKSSPPITSPLFEQSSIQIKVAAAEFIEEPTTEHWERLVHLFCVERLLGQKHQKQPLEEEGQCDVMDDDGTVMHTEVVVVAAKKDAVHVVTNASSVGCSDEHDDSFCTAHENIEELNEDSFRTANESEEESSVDYEHEDSFRTANENEEESSDEEEEDIVAVEPPVDNDDDEHAMIIKAAQSIHLEGSTSRKALVSNPWMDAFRLAYQLL